MLTARPVVFAHWAQCSANVASGSCNLNPEQIVLSHRAGTTGLLPGLTCPAPDVASPAFDRAGGDLEELGNLLPITGVQHPLA